MARWVDSGPRTLEIPLRGECRLKDVRPDLNPRGQRAMDGAAVGDGQETVTLLLAQLAAKLDLPLDEIDFGIGVLTFRGILNMDLRVVKANGDAV